MEKDKGDFFVVQELYEKNIFIYILIGLLGCGILFKLIISLIYSRLVKASDNMATSKNKVIKTIKKKFEACYKLKIGVNNVDIFVDKYVFRQRFCGILLSTWENLCGQILVLCLLVGSISTILGLIYECGKQQILSTFSVGILSSGLLIFLEGFINITAKKEILRLNMKDYFENILKVRLEQENESPELIEQYKKDFLQDEVVQAVGSHSLLAATSEKQSKKSSKPSKFIKKQEKIKAKRLKKEEAMAAKELKKENKMAKAAKKEVSKKIKKESRHSEKLEAKRKAKEEKIRIKNETKLAIEKKKEQERLEIERIRAMAKEEEKRRKEEKQRQKEIKKMLKFEKKLAKKNKKSKAEINKEILLREVNERRNQELTIEEVKEKEEALQDKTAATTSFIEVLPANVVDAKVKELHFEEKKENEEKFIVKGDTLHSTTSSSSKGAKTVKERKVKASTPEEQKLFEDILKEFLA